MLEKFGLTALIQLPAWALTAIKVLLIGVVALILVRVAARLIDRLGKTISGRIPSAGDVRRIATLTSVVRYVTTIAIFVLTVLIMLGELGISVAPLLGAAGVVGIAVGFGAQSLVKDFFTGFFLLLDDQIRAGDVVNVAGHGGLVEDINLRRVQLRDYEGNVHYVPNGHITTVTNMSRGFAFAVTDIGVSYGEDTDAVCEVLRQVAAQMRQDTDLAASILDDLDIAGVDQLADSAVVIKCRIKCVALDQWKIRREFLARTKKAFDAKGIEIPFPHLTVIAPTLPS